MEKIEKDTLAFEMAKQLHEQYAANDNAKASNVISFIAAIAFVFIGFGYVYVQPYLKDRLNDCADYPLLLFSAYIIAIVMLVLMSSLCVNFGYSTRRDHVVITRLRNNYAENETKEWFNEKFKGNGKNILTFLPGYYKIMFVFMQIFIFLIAVGCIMNEKDMSNYCICIILIGIIAILVNLAYLIWKFCNYCHFQDEKEKEKCWICKFILK